MATSFPTPGIASQLQSTDALSVTLTGMTPPDGWLCILVMEAGFGGTVASIVDSAGNDYMPNLRQSTDPVNNNFSAVSFINNCQGYAGGGKSITVTWTAPMHAWLRLFAYPQGEMQLDQWDVTHLSSPTGSFSGATLTPKYEGSLIFSYLATHAAGGDIAVSSSGAGAGFRTVSGPSGTDAAEDMVQATAAPIAATWTSDVNSRNSVWTLIFRPYGWLQNNDNNSGAYIQGLAITSYSFLNGPVSTGNTVVLFFGWNDSTVDAPVLSDNATGATNSYTVLAPLNASDAHIWYVACCNNVRGHPTQVTIALQHTPSAILTNMCELGGSWSFDSFDKRRIAGNASGQNYPLGTVTPQRNGALIYGVSVQYTGSADTTRVSGPFRRTFTNVIQPSTMIQATAATITPTYFSNDSEALGSFVVALDPSVQVSVTAALLGSGHLAANLRMALASAAALHGTGALTAQMAQILVGQAVLSGAGALTANLDTLSAPAVLVKSGVLSGGRVAIPRLIGASDFLIPKK